MATMKQPAIHVVCYGGHHFAERIDAAEFPNYLPCGHVFSEIGNMGEKESHVRERAKRRARREGISHVINLDLLPSY